MIITEDELLKQARKDLAKLKTLLSTETYQALSQGAKGIDAYNHSNEVGEVPFFDFNYLSLSGTIYQDVISGKPYIDGPIEVWLTGHYGPQYYIDYETGELEEYA